MYSNDSAASSADIEKILARLEDLEHLFEEYCVLDRLARLERRIAPRAEDEAT
jgi:hypothetical protein